MEPSITKEKLFELMPLMIDRLTPYIITEVDNQLKSSLFQKALTAFEQYVILENIKTPKSLFEFISTNQNQLIIIRDDIFNKRKTYLDIVQGAVCSSPDSMELWNVSYLNEKEFTFNGMIILCTRKTIQEVKSDKRLSYFVRDCSFI